MSAPATRPAAIRGAHAAEAATVAAVRMRSVRAGYAAMAPPAFFDTLSPRAEARWWRDRHARHDPRLVHLVAARGGRIVGLLNGGPAERPGAAPGAGEITSLFVEPEEWGAGTAAALFAAGCRALRRRGFRDLTLWTRRDNRRAHRFYATHGWRRDGAWTHYRLDGYAVTEIRYRAP